MPAGGSARESREFGSQDEKEDGETYGEMYLRLIIFSEPKNTHERPKEKLLGQKVCHDVLDPLFGLSATCTEVGRS